MVKRGGRRAGGREPTYERNLLEAKAAFAIEVVRRLCRPNDDDGLDTDPELAVLVIARLVRDAVACGQSSVVVR